MNGKLLPGGFLLGWLFLSCAAHAEIRIAIYPWQPVETMLEKYRSIANRLSVNLEEKVKLILSRDTDAFIKTLQNQSPDLVFMEPHIYLQHTSIQNYQAILSAEKTGPAYNKSAIVTSKASGITRLQDLGSHTLVLGSNRQALFDYALPVSMNRSRGLRPGKNLKILHTPSSIAALASILRTGKGATGISEQKLNQYLRDKKQLAANMKILDVSRSVPTYSIWAVRSALPEERKTKILQFILGQLSSASSIPGHNNINPTNHSRVTQDFSNIRQ